MGEHQDEPARASGAGSEGKPGRRKSPGSDTQSPDDVDMQGTAETHSPRAAKAPRIHPRGSSQEKGPHTYIQQHQVTPEQARRQVTGSRVPHSQLGPQYYRMASGSAIQPTFGTSFVTDSTATDEEAQNRRRGESTPQRKSVV